MTSDEALKNAVDILAMASFSYPSVANSRARVATAWVDIAQFLRDQERDDD